MDSSKVLKGVVLVIMLATLGLSNTAFGQDDQLSIQDLKEAIIAAISDARNLAEEEPFFLVKKVNLELRGTTKTDVRGGFSIPIFPASIDLGAKIGNTSQEKLALVLVPAETVVVGGGEKINLVELIQDLKETFRKEKNETLHFILTSVEYEKIWTLQRNAEGGINFIIARAEGAISEEKQQKIKFTLCETVNLKDCAGE